MRRREFIGAAGAATMFALTARTYAQGNGRTPRIAIVAVATRIEDITIHGVPAFKGYFSELERLGYIEGTNLLVERYSALGRFDRFQDIAQTVVERAPDLIVTWSNVLALRLKSLTTTIPIVLAGADPIAAGLITNLARPEANVTGVSSDAGTGDLGQAAPSLRRRSANAEECSVFGNGRYHPLGQDRLRSLEPSRSAAEYLDTCCSGW